MTTYGVCKIANFLPGKYADKNDEEGTIFFQLAQSPAIHNIFYKPPESFSALLRGEQQARYTEKADIWSFGRVALEMWSGRRPWVGQDAVAVIYEARYALLLVYNNNVTDRTLNADDFIKGCSEHSFGYSIEPRGRGVQKSVFCCEAGRSSFSIDTKETRIPQVTIGLGIQWNELTAWCHAMKVFTL